MTKILITGASGFIGSFLVEEAIKYSFTVWAGVRSTSSRRYLQDSRIRLAILDLSDQVRLRAQLLSFKKEIGKWDYIIHCAGATQCSSKKEFERINYGQTQCFVEALIEMDMVPRQFIFISTLSIYGPIHEDTYQPILSTDLPCPNTSYGKSKLKAEEYLQGLSGFPYLIYRPTGVYGPREKDYFLMAKSIRRHLDLSVGYKKQDITFIYVKDLVNAVYLGIRKGLVRKSYNLSDGEVYSSRDFSALIQKELKVNYLIHIKCPLVLLKIVSLSAEWMAKLSGTSSTLNSDKYKIMKQRNWRCDIAPAIRELGFTPGYNLEQGVKETIAWYKQEGWL